MRWAVIALIGVAGCSLPANEQVSVVERDSAAFARDVQPVLEHDRIRPFPHEAVEPATRRLVLRRSGNSGPEGHLGFDIRESLSPIERTGRCLVALAGDQQRGGEGQK